MLLESMEVLTRASSANSPGLERIRAAGMVVGKGGQVFKMRRSAGSLLGFWLDVLPLLAARRLRVPAALFSVTIGPYEQRSISKWLASRVLRRLQFVVVRDQRSADVARELGVAPGRLRVAPDSVFAIRLPTQAERDSVARLTEPGAGRYGVVTVLPWKQFDEVATVVIRAVRVALDEGRVDQIVVVVQTTTDLEASERFVSMAHDERVRLVGDELSPGELMALYARARFVVAGRMHSAILALVAGTPAHPIRPKGLDKASEMLDVVGLADFVCQVDSTARPLDASSDHLRELLRRDCDEEGEVRERVHRATLTARQQVEQVADELVMLHRCYGSARITTSPVDDSIREAAG
jgi:polysaccharide pyruvyl transferase WcaK-like protein